MKSGGPAPSPVDSHGRTLTAWHDDDRADRRPPLLEWFVPRVQATKGGVLRRSTSEEDPPVDTKGPHAADPNGPPVTGNASRSDQPFWCGHGTLLVVDDDPAVREVVTSLLERCGLTVLAAADGQSALEVFRRRANEIRLVLLDLVLPDTDGEAVFRSMRQMRPDLRAILCSGCLTDGAADQKLRAGWAAVIRKPFRLIPFLQTVQAALEG